MTKTRKHRYREAGQTISAYPPDRLAHANPDDRSLLLHQPLAMAGTKSTLHSYLPRSTGYCFSVGAMRRLGIPVEIVGPSGQLTAFFGISASLGIMTGMQDDAFTYSQAGSRYPICEKMAVIRKFGDGFIGVGKNGKFFANSDCVPKMILP